MDHRSHIDIIGVPLDHGAGRRGVGMGPGVLRIAKLNRSLTRLGYGWTDLGDIHIDAPEMHDQGDQNARFLDIVAGACEELCRRVAESVAKGHFPLVIGGDHSIAIGTISGIVASKQPSDPVGVLWFDAHADINTPESSPSGNIHGMPVACLLGNGPERLTSLGRPGPKLNPDKVVQIGLRDIDAHERDLLKASGIHAYTMADIDKRGMYDVMQEALAIVTNGTSGLHVSFDIDSVDPRVAPGTGTPKLGGLTYREAHLAMEMVAESMALTSMEMVEVNPVLDRENQTAEIAVGLISSALGQRIL